MLGTAIGAVAKAIIGAIAGAIGKLLALFAAYRAGEKAQAEKDQSATLDALIRERDAQGRAPSTPEELAKNAKEGHL